MILDGILVFCGTMSSDDVIAGQLVTATGNTLSTNTIDLAPATKGAANQPGDYGIGTDLDIGMSIMQTLTSGGSATVGFELVQADDAALTTNLEVIAKSAIYGFATLTAGTIVELAYEGIEPLGPRRYLGMRVVIAVAALTNSTGQFFSYIPSDVVGTKNRYYKSGFAIT